jgi:hypothetical protein
MAAGSPSSVAAEPLRSTPAPGVPLVGGARLPLAFIALGLTLLAAAAAVIVFAPGLWLLPPTHPHVVGLVHLWLPGFLLSVCLGAVYQLMPVILGVPLRLGLPAAWTHFALHGLGVSWLVAGFMTGQFTAVAAGGALMMAGLGILSYATFRTFAASSRRDAAAWCFPLAAGWLALTVVLGVVMAWNRHQPFLPLSILDLLRTHAHLGLVGFFVSLLQGVAFQLVPMFTMGTLRRPGLIRHGLVGTQLGLLLLAPGLAWHQPPLMLAGAVFLVGALVCSGIALRATLQTRRRRKLETGLQAFVAGAGCLGFAAALGVAMLLLPDRWVHEFPSVALYGLFVVAGALSLTVLGMLCKIIPFLVWMRAYGPWVGKRPVPVATSLASPLLERWWLRLYLLALFVIGAGIAASSVGATAAGGALLALAVALLLGSFLRVARHLYARAHPVPPAQPVPVSP